MGYALPPKRRYAAQAVSPSPILDMDQVQAALSSLPAVNLMDRHIDSMHPARNGFTSKSVQRAIYPGFMLEESDTEELSSTSQSKNNGSNDQTSSTSIRKCSKGKPPLSTATSKESRKIPKKTLPGGSKRWDLILSNFSGFTKTFDSDIDLHPSSSSDDEPDYSLRSKKKPKKKAAKVKKSKKSKSSKPKTKTVKKKEKGTKESKSKRKLTSLPTTPSHPVKAGPSSGIGTSARRLKSVVVKVDKSNKKFKSKEFLSSSDSSDSESTPKPRLRSVVSLATPSSSSSSAAPSGSSIGSGSSRQSTDITTPSSALDLSTGHALNSSPFLLERMSMSSSIKKQKNSRRWESDDDEEQDLNSQNQNDDDSDSSISLLSVGKFEEERARDSDDSGDSIGLSTRARKRQRLVGKITT